MPKRDNAIHISPVRNRASALGGPGRAFGRAISNGVSRSPRETQFVARALAQKIIKNGIGKRAVVIALAGELGAGKTTFAQGFLKSLGVRGRIASPTFIFVRRYALPRKRQRECNRAGFRHAYHFDLYRVRRAEDLRRVGFYEALRDPEAVVIIEWPEHAGKSLKKSHRIRFWHGRQEKERKIGFS